MLNRLLFLYRPRHPAQDRDDVLNIGGFSDAAFSVVASFLDGGASRFVSEV